MMTTISMIKRPAMPRTSGQGASGLSALAWPIERLGDAIETLASKRGLEPRSAGVPAAPTDLARADEQAIERWIETSIDWLGLEAEQLDLTYADVDSFVSGAGPGLIRLPGNSQPAFLVIVGRKGRTVVILAPDLTTYQIQPGQIRTALCHDLEAPLLAEVEHMLDAVGVPARWQKQARKVVLRERLGAVSISGCWRIHPSPSMSLWRQVCLLHLPRSITLFVGAHAIQYAMWHLSLWVVAQGALTASLDLGRLLTWVLLLLTILPFRLLAGWLQSRLIVRIGQVMKRRIMHGALTLAPEEIRHQGVGQLFGRVMELEMIDSLAPSGGLLALTAVIELVLVAVALSFGAGGGLHALLLVVWIVASAFVGWQHYQRRSRWTSARLEMTHDLVERMVGHRTRLAQERREHWHDGEDQLLARYLELSHTLDRNATLLVALVPRGWLIVGLIGLAFAFVAGSAAPAAIAVSLGGILSGFRAFRKLAEAYWILVSVAIAWKQVGMILQAAARTEPAGPPTFALEAASNRGEDKQTGVLLDAHNLVFRYHDCGEPVLRGCSMHIQAGDRLLLEGPSGGGKSTLVTLLTGVRRPTSGLLLLHGLDQHTLGSSGWRQRVAAAPQFHENHVLTETFAFNLLMGRHWPPRSEDLAEAQTICHELGLSDLLQRMPAGMLQMVGEAGWQLSHGEKSRLYIARSLLQNADLVILDESFAALDPETLQLALRCVLRRAKTLLVIAHP